MSVPTYPCGRCGRKSTAEQMTYSRFTGRRYCHDTRACNARIRRLKRQGAIFKRGFLVNLP